MAAAATTVHPASAASTCTFPARISRFISHPANDRLTRTGPAELRRAGVARNQPHGRVDRRPAKADRNEPLNRISRRTCEAATHGPDGWVDRRPTEAGGNEPPTRLSRLMRGGSFGRLLLNVSDSSRTQGRPPYALR